MRWIGYVAAATIVMVLASCADERSTTTGDGTGDAAVQEGSPPSDTPVPTDDYTGDGLGKSPPPTESSASSSPGVTDAQEDDGCISAEVANAVLELSLDVVSLSDGVIRDCFYQDLDKVGWIPAVVRVYSADHPDVASWEPGGPPPEFNLGHFRDQQPAMVEGKERSIYASAGEGCAVVTRSPSDGALAMVALFTGESVLPGDPCDIAQEFAELAESLPPVE